MKQSNPAFGELLVSGDHAPGSLLPNLAPRSRLLFVRLRSIGDIILLTPGLRLLKAWRSDLKTHVLVESRFRELLEGNPDVDEVLTLEHTRGWGRALRAQSRLIRQLRRREFSLCINLHGGPTSAWLTRMSGARWKAGFHHYRQAGAYDFLIPDARGILNQPALHTAELQACALFWLGLPRAPVPRARLGVGSADREWWHAERSEAGIASGPYAIIHPGALYATKRWPADRFAELGAYLEEARGLAVFYSAGPGERGLLDEVARNSPLPIRRLEGSTLGQFAAALEAAAVFVGNDTGPAHMAVALGRPAVVVFGSSSSAIWGPWPHAGRLAQAPVAPALVVQNHYECNPCRGDCCYSFDRPECILSVAVKQVRAAVDAVLNLREAFTGLG